MKETFTGKYWWWLVGLCLSVAIVLLIKRLKRRSITSAPQKQTELAEKMTAVPPPPHQGEIACVNPTYIRVPPSLPSLICQADWCRTVWW